MTASRAYRPWYIAEAGKIYREHPCGFRQHITDDAAKRLMDSHRRICARTGRHMPPSGLIAGWLQTALAEAALQRADTTPSTLRALVGSEQSQEERKIA